MCQGTGFQGGAVVKNLTANAGDARDSGSIPESGRYPGVGNGSPFQYSCMENPMDRGIWQTTVHGVTKSQTRLSDATSLLHALPCGPLPGDIPPPMTDPVTLVIPHLPSASGTS